MDWGEDDESIPLENNAKHMVPRKSRFRSGFRHSVKKVLRADATLSDVVDSASVRFIIDAQYAEFNISIVFYSSAKRL